MKTIIRLVAMTVAAAALAGCGRGCSCSRDKTDAAKDEAKGTISERLVASAMERAMRKSGEENPDVHIADGKVRIRSGDGESEMEITEGGLTISSKEGNSEFQSGPGAKIPDDFPKDLPVLEGATILHVMTSDKVISASFESGQSLADVTAFYAKAMADGGWEKVQSVDMGKQAMVSYKKDNRVANIMILDDNGKRTVTVSQSIEE